MAVEIKLPELGEGIESGDILTLLVAEGDHVDAQQSIVEMETEKAVVEVPCSTAGTISKIHIAEGQTVNVGDVLVTIEPSEAATTDAPKEEAPPAAEPAAPQPVTVSEPADTSVAATTPPTPAPAIAVAPPQPATATAVASPPRIQDGGSPAPAGPAVRRLARELGVNLAHVHGTGAGGRIQTEDVHQAVRAGTQVAAAPSPAIPPPRRSATPTSPAPTTASGESDAWGPIRRERMSKIRKMIAERMSFSKNTCPHVTNFDDADVTELEEVRQASKADYAASGVKLTTMPFLIKAVAQSLKLHPTINASIDSDAGEIVYKEYVNVGIAVDTDRGLVVPVIRQADAMPIPDIARSLGEMAESVRAGSFSMDDLKGGTFTISNLGAIGGTYSTPIINHPEVAILLVGRTRKLPVVVNDQIEVRLMMPLSLSYDHRLVDGAAAARFLNEVKDLLQNPSRLLLIP